MTPERIDVSIICAKCGKPVEKRMMQHDPAKGLFIYSVECHGESDSGPHLQAAHTLTLTAFLEKKNA